MIYIGHPAHVHFFKNFVKQMEKKGHKIKILVVSKDITTNLLKKYNLEYELIDSYKPNLLNKVFGLIKRNINFIRHSIKFKPDIYLGIANVYGSHTSFLFRKPSIWFSDTETSKQVEKLTLPFCSNVLTPTCFKKNLGKKHILYKGFHELAYLHPNQFKPNKNILKKLNLKEGEKFFVLRFVSWKSAHIRSEKGFSLDDKKNLIEKLEKHGKVFITSEVDLPNHLNKYKLSIEPSKIHDLIYYSTMYIGEGATMATESGILGTPSFYISSMVYDFGNFIELKKLGLVESYRNYNNFKNRLTEILKNKNIKKEWKVKRDSMLKDKIDVTSFIIWFVENYPNSAKEMKNNPKLQKKFIKISQ